MHKFRESTHSKPKIEYPRKWRDRVRRADSFGVFLGMSFLWCVRTIAWKFFEIAARWFYFASFCISRKNWHLSILSPTPSWPPIATTTENKLQKFPFASTICSSINGTISSFESFGWMAPSMYVQKRQIHFSDDNRKVSGAISITLKTWAMALCHSHRCQMFVHHQACRFYPSFAQSVGFFPLSVKCLWYALLRRRRFSVKWLKWC